MPSKLHMTVPKEFRRNSKLPEVLVLYRAHLDPDEVQEMHGVRVMRPLRTILDLMGSGHVDRSQLKQAIDEAIRGGLIAKPEMDRISNGKVQTLLRELVGGPAQ
jgi:hypothetical protein